MRNDMKDIMEIYPWLTEYSDAPGNVRLSEFGRQAASTWIMEGRCPTVKLALAVDLLSNVPSLAKIVAESYGITIHEDIDAERVRKRIVKTIVSRIRRNKENEHER